MDVVVPAGKVVPQFMNQENPEKCDGKGQSGKKGSRMAIEISKGFQQRVKRSRLVMGKCGGEVRSGDKGSAHRQKKQSRGEDQGTSRRMRRSGDIIPAACSKRWPYRRLQISGSALF